MIVIDKIRFKNLCSSGNFWTEISLSNYRNTLLVGFNASGKSQTLQAINFALFGKPMTKITIGSLINSINGKGLETEIIFRKGVKSYSVKRGLKPDNFEIYEDSDLIPVSSSKADYQKKLEDILGFDYSTFNKVAILASATYTPFMNLSQSDRRELIEKLLDLEIFSSMNDLAKEDLKNIKKELKSIDDDLYKIRVNIDSKEKLQLNINKNYNDEKLEFLNKIKELEDSIALKDLKKLEFSLELEKSDEAKYKKVYEKIKLELRELQDSLVEINLKNKNALNDLKFLKVNDICPTCHQEINEGHKEELRKVIEVIETDNLKNKEKDLSYKISKFDVWSENLEKIKRQIANLEADQKTLEKEIVFYNREIDKLDSKASSDYSEDIKNLKKELKLLEDKKNEKMEEKSVIDVSLMLLKDDGIKADIIKTYIPIMNKIINEYLEKFDFFVKFEIDEEFNECLKSRHRDKFSFLNFSEGEKSRISLAILFALREITKRKNRMNLNLLVLDEVLERVDAAGASALVKILRNSEDTNHVIISHNPEIIDMFTSESDQIIKVEKKGNFSYYSSN